MLLVVAFVWVLVQASPGMRRQRYDRQRHRRARRWWRHVHGQKGSARCRSRRPSAAGCCPTPLPDVGQQPRLRPAARARGSAARGSAAGRRARSSSVGKPLVGPAVEVVLLLLRLSEQDNVGVPLRRHRLLGLLPGTPSSVVVVAANRRLGVGGLPMGLSTTMSKMMLSLSQQQRWSAGGRRSWPE